MHFAHARARCYTGMAISCVDLISVGLMHFLRRVISPQGSARGCHEFCGLYPPPPQPNPSSSSSGQSPARQQDMADPAAIPDYTHDSGCRLAVRGQSRIQLVFFCVFFSLVCTVFLGTALSLEKFIKMIGMF